MILFVLFLFMLLKWDTFYICFFNKLLDQSTRDVSTGATGATAVAPKFSDTLTLFQPRGADSAHHWHGRTYIFLVVTSLGSMIYKRVKSDLNTTSHEISHILAKI